MFQSWFCSACSVPEIYRSAIKVSISVSRASFVGGATFLAPLPLAVPLPLPLDVALPLPLPAPTLALNPLTPPADLYAPRTWQLSCLLRLCNSCDCKEKKEPIKCVYRKRPPSCSAFWNSARDGSWSGVWATARSHAPRPEQMSKLSSRGYWMAWAFCTKKPPGSRPWSDPGLHTATHLLSLIRFCLHQASSLLVFTVTVQKDKFQRVHFINRLCTWATPAAISIFIARPSSGTPSYCFIAADHWSNQIFLTKLQQNLVRGTWLFLIASAGPCLSTRQGWARETTQPRSDIRSRDHHTAVALTHPILVFDFLPLMASLFRS